MKRTLLYFLLAFIAVILAACELNKTKPGKIIFDRVPFVYATINGQRELFLIDTGASTSMERPPTKKSYSNKYGKAYKPRKIYSPELARTPHFG